MSVNIPLIMLVFALLSPCAGPCFAEEPGPVYGPEQVVSIAEARIRISEISDAAKDGDIASAAAAARIERILARLNEELPKPLTEAALMELSVPDTATVKTAADRKKSFFEGIDFLRLGLIAVFTILTLLLIGKHLILVLYRLPRMTWEIVLYLCGIGILGVQGGGIMSPNQFSALFACLLIGGGLALTYVIHREYFEDFSNPGTSEFLRGKYYMLYICPAIMTAVFGIAALITGSSWLGAFAVLSLMTLLGCTGEVIPMGYVVGFRGNDALARATSAGLCVMALFMALRVVNIVSPVIHTFEAGGLIVGGFVGYLGLLIASSIYYERRLKYGPMQAVALVACFAGVTGGSLIGISSVQIIAGVFLALWAVEKLVEIPGRGFVPWILKLMAASGGLYLIVTYAAPLYARYLMG